jgi:hypothetical protein
MFKKFAYRPNDIIVSCAAKSGTTWTMNIVHQIRSYGDSDFGDIYWEVPWIEFLERPGQTQEELLHRWARLPSFPRRAFKTHAPPPILPLNPKVKYVVPFRNGLDTVVSFYPFLANHNSNFMDMWNVPEMMRGFPSLDACFGFCMQMFVHNPNFFWTFAKGWWPHRHAPNVLFIHFSDMIKDHEGSMRKIAKFLEVDVPESRWPRILEYTSFPWMKKHGSKFEISHVAPMKVLKSDGMLRKGQVGESATLSEEQQAKFNEVSREFFQDDKMFHWLQNGGELPE